MPRFSPFIHPFIHPFAAILLLLSRNAKGQMLKNALSNPLSE
jgi:hypothetical protein